jgi:mutator protein MutT
MTEPETNKTEVVTGVVVENKKALIVQRQKIELGENQALLHWVFPGGRVEAGETEEEALFREVSEESGRSVEIKHLIDKRQHPEFPVVISYYYCTPIDQSMVGISTEEIRETRWVDFDELSQYFTSSLNPAVAEFLETLK